MKKEAAQQARPFHIYHQTVPVSKALTLASISNLVTPEAMAA